MQRINQEPVFLSHVCQIRFVIFTDLAASHEGRLPIRPARKDLDLFEQHTYRTLTNFCGISTCSGHRSIVLREKVSGNPGRIMSGLAVFARVCSNEAEDPMRPARLGYFGFCSKLASNE